jgi:hypothetical protein
LSLKQKRVAKRKISETTVIRRSKRLKLKKDIMKGSLWNSDGFKEPAKHSVVHEAIREFWLDFFAVLETGQDNFPAPFLKNLSGGLEFVWY